MAKNLQVNLQLNIAQAQAALKQLQQQAQQSFGSSGGGRSAGGSSGGGGGLGGFIGGSAATAAAGAAAAALGTVAKSIDDLAKRAVELSQSASSSASSLGQLRSAIERAGISKDLGANNPGIIDFAKAKADSGKIITDFTAGLTGTKQQRDKAAADALGAGLGGKAGEDWRRMKEQGVDMEKDISIARTALDTQTFRQRRDYAVQLKNFQVDTARQQQDLDKEGFRQNQDYQIASQRFQENFQAQQSAKQFAINQQFAVQSYQISQGRMVQDYQLSQSRNQQDYSISRSDKAFDFGLSQSRNQQEFDINKSRAQTSRKNQIFDMAMGGANGLQFLQASRDFNLQQQYAQQDFARSKNIATQDYSISAGRDQRGFQIGQQRAGQDLRIGQQRAGQDFGISQQQAMAGRQLEIESQLYQRKYEGLELELQHNRAVQDLNISLERLNQNVTRDKAALQRQGQDMDYDQNLAYANFNLQTMRQRRNYGYAQADFAGAQRLSNPIGAAGQAAQDATFAQALDRNAKQTGQADLIDQYNKARQDQENSLALKVGAAVAQAIGQANDAVGNLYNPNNNLLGGGPFGPALPNKSNASVSGSFGPAIGGWDDANKLAAANAYAAANNPTAIPASVYNSVVKPRDDYMDGPARADAGRQNVTFNIGGSSAQVVGDPQAELKFQQIAQKAAQDMAKEMLQQWQSLYGG